MNVRPFLIGPDWIATTQTAEVVDPFTGRCIAKFCTGDGSHVEAALRSAQEAWTGPVRHQTAHERAAVLERAAGGIRRRKDEFAQLIVAEAGKPITLAEAEVGRAEQTFLFAARAASEGPGGGLLEMDASVAGRGHTGIVRRFPVGVILAVTPFNFPLNLVAHKLAPALATGNAVVLKPSPRTPLCALLLGEVLLEAGLPPGQVCVVPFDHSLVSGVLGDPRVKMLSFTGSAAVGWQLKGAASHARVTLELGGNAAAVIHGDARWQEKIRSLADAAFAYAGQSCISLQRLYVQSGIYEEFKAAFVAHVRSQVHHGDPRDRSVIVGPLIDTASRDRILTWVDEAMKLGAHLLTDLRPRAEDRCLPPIILEGMPPQARISREEVFGPVVLLDRYDTFEEALAMVNGSPYGLQAGVFTRDTGLAWRAFEALEVGGVLINQVPTFRVENMPYGGIKDSGLGREGVRYAMEEMTELRSLIFNLEAPVSNAPTGS